MYKNIIPGLVSFETDLDNLRGFYFTPNFSFYLPTKDKQVLHYRINLTNLIDTKDNYTVRHGYCLGTKTNLWYKRKLAAFVSLHLSYEQYEKQFKFNTPLSLLPFEVGGLMPAGKIIADFINYELFLMNYIVLRACAFKINNTTIIIVAPGFNGKTSVIEKVLNSGGKYIAEDLIVWSPEKECVWGTAAFAKNFGRKENKSIVSKLTKNNILSGPIAYDTIYFAYNSTIKSEHNDVKNLVSYLFVNSMFFLNNNFVKLAMFQNNEADRVLSRLTQMSQFLETSKIKHFNVINWDWEKIIYG